MAEIRNDASTEALIHELRVQAAIAREERAKTDALFASIGEGVIATDEKGRIIKINQVALDVLGYRRRDLMDKWFPTAIVAVRDDGSVIEALERPIARAFMSGETVNVRMQYKRKDGRLIPVVVTVSPILMRGRPVGAIEVFRDVSFDMQSDTAKTEFISVASHQLRTPLAAVNTYSHMLAEGYVGDLNEDQKSFMTIILSAVGRMNELISTLLNITRIEAGSIMVDSSPVQPEDMIAELMSEFQPQIDEKNLNAQTRLPRTRLKPVATDPLLAKEVLSNLVSNAIKYTPEGGSVTVSLQAKPKTYVFAVADTGYGIPIAAQPLIFTKFFRASNILATEVSGTGLGLYLIKIIAENLSGDVWFKSQENKGSTFYFSLPRDGSPKRMGTFRLEA